MKRALLITFLLIFVGLVAWSWLRRPVVTDSMLTQVRSELLMELESLWNKSGMRRSDGYIYAVDVGHLLIHSALVGDRPLYEKVKGATLETLIVDRRDDPYTQGFVGWRVRPGRPLDASGTTEALRIARGLWNGSQRFELPNDRALALKILDGYRRHAYMDQGVWLVRNYFNFETRSFANDSFLVDYDPDLIREVAKATGDAELKELAERSYAAVLSALSPAGLFHTLIQPDLRTIMPDAPITVFSPNDVIQVNNACTVAETVTEGDHDTAVRFLDFVAGEGRRLKRSYYGRTGDEVDTTRADSTAWSCLVRLAAHLNRPKEMNFFLEMAYPGWRWLLDNRVRRPFATTEAILAIDAALELNQ
jgi:hypothetical protein